ncbi:MAG TPA: DegV family protein, partial [Bacteroidales bacterium]|nr:DegV family protein [Bacteroidales bacterium]
MTKSDKITSISGRLYYRIFLAGANKILENQKVLNQINVFPVPDADTGTNLASTCRYIIDNARPDDSFKVTADEIAVAALNGARGNSGVIFAQFLYGMSVESGDHPHLTIHAFAEAIRKSVDYVYDAIANPVEGTMLTVIREWADFIYSHKDIIDDFYGLFSRAYDIAAKALVETTSKLKALSLANVVDAGAKGFVLFLEGIMEGIRKRSSKRQILGSAKAVELAPFKSIPHEDFTFRYCTEAVVKGNDIDKQSLKEELSLLGDSLVIAGAGKMVRLHIHTDTPPLLFEKLEKYGTITFQKADDMEKQNQVVSSRKWNIALVTDSTCDLPGELTDFYQIHYVPLNIHFGETQYIDKITLKPARFFKLLEDAEQFPSTSQPNESAFLNMYSHLASHYDSVIAVHLSEKFSGTLRNSRNAADRISKEMNKKITVLDSRHVSGSLGLLTLRVARAIENGLSHDDIVGRFQHWRENTRIYV